ncbi:MAG: hypothetical protein ACNA7U_03825 [Candidatus Izemoplasmataceae bacterium]
MDEPVVNNPDVESIFESVKKLLGLPKEEDSFDTDIIVHINTVFSNLHQMGIGPDDGFYITGYNETWSNYTLTNPNKKRQIRSYIPLKVKQMFDPSANANVSKSLENTLKEIEYRLYTEEGGY